MTDRRAAGRLDRQLPPACPAGLPLSRTPSQGPAGRPVLQLGSRLSREPVPSPPPGSPFPSAPCSSGTFDPPFDGRPRKGSFHILNLLAPANHLNLPPSAPP